MSSFGVTSEGINVKTLEIVLDELVDDEQSAYGPAINTTPESVLGQLNSIFGDKITELWEVVAAVYASQYSSAQDASLDNVAAITGATRLPATKSTVTLRANLDPATILNVGRVVSVSTSNARFVTTEQVQNGTGAPANIPVEAESEEFGPILGSDGTIDTIETPVSGWTAQAAINSSNVEPFALSDTQTLDIEIDGGAVQTVTFVSGDFVSIGAATALEVAASINTQTTGLDSIDANGAVRITSDTDGPGSAVEITGGSSNVALGFDLVLVAGMNDDDAVIGRNIESDQDFRIRREELLRISGAATVEAIRSAVREVEDVVQAFVFENVTLVTDGNGLPGKSIEIVVSGGDNQTIAETIFNTKAAGIETYRDPGVNGVTITIEDSQGQTHDINFSRPTLIQMFTEVDVSVDGALFGGGDQSAGEQQVRDAIAVLGQQQEIGQDVIILSFQCAPLGVAGVFDVPVIKIDVAPPSPPPVNTANIELEARELATFDSGDVVVNVAVV